MALTLVGCAEAAEGSPGETSGSRDEGSGSGAFVEVAASRALRTAASFALVPSGEGALLVWSDAGGVHAQALGPLGEATGEPVRRIASRSALELDAAAASRRVGVAWIEESAEVRGSYSLDGGRTFAAPRALDATEQAPPGERGRLALAADEAGELVLYHRILDGPCVASDGRCARVKRTLVRGAAHATRGTEPLEIRRPCAPLVSGALWHEGTFYYAVCHADPAPAAMAYAIRPALRYAAPLDVPGCAPVGLAPLETGVALVTRCGERATATHLDPMGRPRGRYDPLAPSVRCRDGRPTIELGEGPRLRLDEARADLEFLLPPSIAPGGARAIWTGEALLVAAYRDGALTLARHRCVEGRFARTDRR